ncbi:MAG: hypothetical protein IJ849_10370 [Selenomonadaceae bacterium]|nr:hypothetical protein [Selenomonadaceae bacterium]
MALAAEIKPDSAANNVVDVEADKYKIGSDEYPFDTFNLLDVDYIYGGYSTGAGTNVTGNTVNILDGVFKSGVGIYGGFVSADGSSIEVNYNHVNITGGNVNGNVYGGSNGKKVVGNTVILDGASATITGNVYGGSLIIGGIEATDNVVTIKKGSINNSNSNGFLDAGWHSTGSLARNKINIEGGSVTVNQIDGGRTTSISGTTTDVSVTDNEVNISGGNVSVSSIKGGNIGTTGAYEKLVSGNQVNISSGTVKASSIYGGYIWGNTDGATATVQGNTISITGGTFDNTATSMIYGGSISNSGAAGSSNMTSGIIKSNEISIAAGVTLPYRIIYGGYLSIDKITTAEVCDNTINFNGNIPTTYSSDILGGWSNSGSVHDNHVTINATNATLSSGVKAEVYGGFATDTAVASANTVEIGLGAFSEVVGGYAASGAANNNLVTINGLTMVSDNAYAAGNYDSFVGHVYGGYSASGVASENTVTVSSGSLPFVVGGRSNSANVSSNAVNIDSGTVARAIGGFTKNNNFQSVSSNTVTVSGGEVMDVIGGMSTHDGAINGNKVKISGGTVTGFILGGASTDSNYIRSNEVEISGSPDLRGALIGGALQSGGIESVFLNHPNYAYDRTALVNDTVQSSQGNTLTVYGKGHTAQNIFNFQNINFHIPVTAAHHDALLTLTDGQTDLYKVTVKAGLDTGVTLADGKEILLMVNNNGINTSNTTFGKLNEADNLVVEKLGTNAIIARAEELSASDNVVSVDPTSYAINNLVVPYTGDMTGVYGGWAASDAVRDTSIIVGGTKTTGAEANNNQVTVSRDVNGNIYGGFSAYSSADNNVVSITGGNIQASIAAAGVAHDSVNSNTLSVSGGTFADGIKLYGGLVDTVGTSAGDTVLSNNTVTVTEKATVPYSLIAGNYSLYGANTNLNVFKGEVEYTGIVPDNHDSYIYGSYSLQQMVRDNVVNVTGTNTAFPTGGKAYVFGGYSENNTLWSSFVTVKGGYFDLAVGGVGTDAISVNSAMPGAYITDNGATISNGAVRSLVGGIAINGTAEGNNAYVKGGKVIGDGTITLFNAPEIKDGFVIGGIGNAAAKNYVEISGGAVQGSVIGGKADSGAANNNTVTLKGGAVNGAVYGGYSIGGGATNNIVNVYDYPDLALATLYGAFSDGGIISGNTLNVYSSGLTAQNIVNFDTLNFYIPGTVKNGDTILTLTGGQTDVRGATFNIGFAAGSPLTNGDKVKLLSNANGILTDSAIKQGKLSWGISLDYDVTVKKADDNNVIALIGEETTPPLSPAEDVTPVTPENPTPVPAPTNPTDSYVRGYTDNVVTIDHANGQYTVNGASVTYDQAGEHIFESGKPTEQILQRNTINVVSGDFTLPVWAAGSEEGQVSDNVLNVTGGSFGLGVWGGLSDKGDVTGNAINFSGGTITEGGASAGVSISGNVRQNLLAIKGGSVVGDIHGGFTDSGEATGNTVTVSGGHIDGDVFGGYSTSGKAYGNTVNISDDDAATRIDCYILGSVSGDGVESSDNTINISGSPDLTEAYLIGSANQSNYQSTVSLGAQGENNTLNIYSSAVTAKNISGFDNINFYLPSTVANGDTVLTLSNTDTGNSNGGQTDLSGTAIGVSVPGDATLSTGDSITLITNANGLITSDATTYGLISQGISTDWGMEIGPSGSSSITATVTQHSTGLKPQTAAVAQSSTPAVFLMDKVVDLGAQWLPPEVMDGDMATVTDTSGETPIATETTAEVQEATEEAKESMTAQAELVSEFHMFGNMGVGSTRTDTGNGHVDSKSWGMDLGWARELDYANGSKLFFAPIIDYGKSSYDSYIDAPGIHGHGNTSYLAGGFIARKALDNGFYIEGSFRMGRTQMDFTSGDFKDANGNLLPPVYYDVSAPCWAGHLHVGRNFRIGKRNRLVVYAMYHHAHQNGMSAHLSSGETYEFDAVDSGRFRLGAKITKQTKRNQRFYTGIAYQFEFSGAARAHYNGYSTPDIGSRGSSFMLETGWQVKPFKNSPWTFDANCTAWVGKQQGVTATLKLKKAF